MPNREADILYEACEKRFTIVGHAVHRGKQVELGVRLISQHVASDERGLWGELLGCRPAWDARLVADSVPLQFHFTTDRAAVFFESAILEKRGWPWGRKRILLRHPGNVRISQRRRHERVRVPKDLRVDGVMRTGDDAGVGIPCRLMSVSCGGLSVAITDGRSLQRAGVGRAVQVVVDYGGSITMEATVRRSRSMREGWIVLGLELIEPVTAGDEASEVGFGRLVGDMMRLQIRRHFRRELRTRDELAA